jgi:hypothetical protein
MVLTPQELDRLRRWFNALPEAEKDLPLIHYGNHIFTPRQVLFEAMRGTPLGETLARMVLAGKIGSPLEEMARMRLLELIKSGRFGYRIGVLQGPYTFSVSPQELARLLQTNPNHPLVRPLIQNEVEHMKRILTIAQNV